MTFPSMKEALELFENGFQKMKSEQERFFFYEGKGFRAHCCMVACCAEIIASSTKEMNGQKAYICGLLHDYGKLMKDADGKDAFHGLTGYDALMK